MPAFHSPNAPSTSEVPAGQHWLDHQILRHCSAGPWQHGLHALPCSAASQPCVYGNERELPLALLDPDDAEAATNVVLLAAGWELCRQLRLLLDAATPTVAAEGGKAKELQSPCQLAADLLNRIQRDLHQSTTERYGKEGDEDD